jgi:DNA-directed RNA polymerase sigma subunit (sigma70/sigma32)
MMSFDKNNPLHIYMREIDSIEPLTKGEEENLPRYVLARDGEAESAGRRLVEAHLGLVVSIADRHFSASVDQFDLIQKGNDGLQQALSTFSGNSQGRLRCDLHRGRHCKSRTRVGISLTKPFKQIPANASSCRH